MRAKAIHECEGDTHDEISFAAGDQLVNVRDAAEDGWLTGTVQRTGQQGLFPAVYAELAPESGDDAVFLRKLQSQGLLSSTLQLDAFRRDLDSGRLASANHTYSSTTTTSANREYSSSSSSLAANQTYATSSFQQSKSAYSSVSAGGSAAPPSLPAKPSLSTRPMISGPQSARALPPPVPVKPKSAVASPPVPPKPHSAVASPPASLSSSYARSNSSQTMSPATSFSQSMGSQTSASLHGSASRQNSVDQEVARQREADAARAWEEKHLAKRLTSADGTREVARLFGGLSTGAKPAPAVSAARKPAPPTGTKPAVTIATKPAVSVATKPAVSLARKPVAAPATKPAIAPKPTAAISTAEQIDLDAERKAAESWEAKHGIGSKARGQSGAAPVASRMAPAVSVARKPVVSSSSPKPALPAKSFGSSASSASSLRETSSHSVTSSRDISSHSTSVQRSNPATENDAPALPHNPARAAVMDQLLQERKPLPSVNPATANDAPALPYSPARAASFRPPEKPVESAVQPVPRSLISRINSQASQAESTRTSHNTSSSSSVVGFSDNFNPAAASRGSEASFHRSYSSSATSTAEESRSVTATAGIPLTQSRNINGPLPFASSRPSDLQQHYSYTNKTSSSTSSSFTQHTSHSSALGAMPAAAIPRDALARYASEFRALDAREGGRGVVSSNAVRDRLAASGLSDFELRRIWQLADRNLDGTFGPGEFNIIMHLVDGAKAGRPVPNTLPIELLHVAYA
ncbi:hypothetical protein LPJ63_004088 [Coemansia sp. RSA 2711]|nr:hypothetical protein LPJ63_004088 [Coemansia sp. RSA 2711]